MHPMRILPLMEHMEVHAEGQAEIEGVKLSPLERDLLIYATGRFSLGWIWKKLVMKCMYSANQYIDLLKNDVYTRILNFEKELYALFKEEEKKATGLNQKLSEDLTAIREVAEQYHALQENLKANPAL